MILAMNAPTLITLLIVLTLLALAMRHIIKNMRGGSSCGCGSKNGCGSSACGCGSCAPIQAGETSERDDIHHTGGHS